MELQQEKHTLVQASVNEGRLTLMSPRGIKNGAKVSGGEDYHAVTLHESCWCHRDGCRNLHRCGDDALTRLAAELSCDMCSASGSIRCCRSENKCSAGVKG